MAWIQQALALGCMLSAKRDAIKGYEAMNMIRKGQLKGPDKGDVMGQISFINRIFGVSA